MDPPPRPYPISDSSEGTKHPRQPLLQHPLGLRDTLNCRTRWGKPGIPSPSPGMGSLHHSSLLPPTTTTWRLECDPRRDPAARRERLCSSWVAAQKGGRCGSDHGDRGRGKGNRKAAPMRVGVEREPRKPVRLSDRARWRWP